MRVAAEIGLPVSCARAWDVLADWESQASWMADADSVVVRSSARAGVGVVLDVRTRVLNVPAFTERLEVIEWEPPRRLLMAHRSFVGGTGEWTLSPAGEGCRFRWTETLSLPGGPVGEVPLVVYRPFMGRLMRRACANLRAEVERRVAREG